MRYIKDLLLILVLGLSLWGIYSCVGCAPAVLAPASAQSPAVTGASVVTLVRPAEHWAWGALSSAEPSAGFKVRYEASCNAFAVPGGLLMTAAHCVDGIEVGGEVRYLSPDGVGHGVATLLSVNDAADLATCAAQGLVPLAVTSPPSYGAEVVGVSSVYGETHYGRILEGIGTTYYQTSVPIIKGWSGSPVFDAQGKVWGVVSQCNLEDGHGPECDNTGSIVAALQ